MRNWFRRRYLDLLGSIYTCGHIDRFVGIMFGSTIDELEPLKVIGRDDLFERMCRVISLTEKRGHKQVEILLRHPVVGTDAQLMKIFRIIELDEPGHWAPYDDWLREHGKREPIWWERAIDSAIHSELLFLKLPILFLTVRTRRLDCWPDEADVSPVMSEELEALAA